VEIRTIGQVSRSIAIATCAQLPDGDTDDAVLADALVDAGFEPAVLAWSDPAVDWAGFAATVIRSTWDYTARRAEFLAWAEAVPRLHNPIEVVRGNSDKRYLAGLAATGIPIVPTEFFAPDEPVRLPDAEEFVLKPSVGAGSRGAGRFTAAEADAALAHAAGLQAAGRTVLAQPYLAEVDTAGETALIFIDGSFSHAIRKAPLLEPGRVLGIGPDDHLYLPETITAREPSPDELAVAEAVVARVSGDQPLLYARIDLLPSPDGPRVIELELTEPSLFLSFDERAATRLAGAIANRVEQPAVERSAAGRSG